MDDSLPTYIPTAPRHCLLAFSKQAVRSLASSNRKLSGVSGKSKPQELELAGYSCTGWIRRTSIRTYTLAVSRSHSIWP